MGSAKGRKKTPSRLPLVGGVGLDVVEISRISALARRNPRFLKRVFSDEEIRYCQGKKKKWQHYAVRFAAKEAVWKALGRNGLPLREISVRRSPTGRPLVSIRGRANPRIHISLTHSDQYAMAVALRV